MKPYSETAEVTVLMKTNTKAILSQFHPPSISTTCSPKIRFNIILPSARSYKWQNVFPISPILATCAALRNLPDFNTLIIKYYGWQT